MKLWQKVALLLVAVALVPLLLASWQIARRSADRLTESIKAYHLATADVALTEVRSLLARAAGEARIITALLSDRDVPALERERALKERLPGLTTVVGMSLHAPDGRRLMHLGDLPAALDAKPIDAAVLQDAAARGTRFAEVMNGDDGERLLPLVMPLVHSGQLTGFARFLVDVTPLDKFVMQLSTRHFGEGSQHIRLIDERFDVIAGPGVGANLTGAPALAELRGQNRPFGRDLAWAIDYQDESGEAMIGAIVPLPELGWGALVEERQSVAYAPVAATWDTALVVAGVALVVALVLAFFIARQITRPVVAMAVQSQKVAGGDFAARIPPTLTHRADELGATATAFNGMAEALGRYRDRLVDETRARENLSRFLAPEVVERVVRGDVGLRLGGEEGDVTVLFADVVGFTGIAENHPPEIVVGLLNELFTIVSEIVFRHGGIIDKFIGDCAMALFGAPDAQPDAPRRAALAAIAIRSWLENANPRWHKMFGRPIEIAISIHSGRAVIGNIGSERRMDYTAIGDTINVGARLERLAAPGQILMSAETASRLGEDFELQPLGGRRIAGREAPIEVVALIDEAL